MSDVPIRHHQGSSEQNEEKPEASSEQKAQMEQAYQQMQRKLRINKIDEDIKHKIMVLSGKGGVGKSTVATGLALSLARMGKKVGIMDIDITGPNVPKMLGLEGTDLHVENGRIHPAIGAHGIKVISMAFLIEDPDKPVIWRGPIKLGAINQFIGDVEWVGGWGIRINDGKAQGTTDVVEGAYLIEPKDSTSGPHILYRPLMADAPLLA